MVISPTANIPQGQFLSMPQRFRMFCSGFGGGKTWVGCMAICKHFWEFPLVNQGYFAPTFSHIRDIFYPTIQEVAFVFGLNVEPKIAVHEVDVFSGRQFRGTVICRSMEKPKNIIGFKIGHALIDEFDVLPSDKAEDSWQKILARMRYNVPGIKNGIDVASTPEGFRFCHKKFVRLPQEDASLATNYGLVQASTYENEKYLPPGYIPGLLESYPAELIKAYINGEFTNLTSGTVYNCYDRTRCNSLETIAPGEPLFIGMDFNVGLMAATVYVQRHNGYHAVAELHDIFDTPAMVRAIIERWRVGEDKQRRIVVYPDVSGGSRHTTDASKSDIAILQQSGLQIRASSTNPAVRDRVLAVNKQFEIGRLWVNAQACPTIARCFEQQAYDANGDPDKSTGFDHQNDASGYVIAYERPIIRPMSRMQITGV